MDTVSGGHSNLPKRRSTTFILFNMDLELSYTDVQ